MEKCSCSELPDEFYCEGALEGFSRKLSAVESGSCIALYRCEICGQFWAVDMWDKYSYQVASRVADPDNWQGATVEQRKKLLLKSRGGVTGETCLWARCEGKRVNGVAYCIDHLYATGATK